MSSSRNSNHSDADGDHKPTEDNPASTKSPPPSGEPDMAPFTEDPKKTGNLVRRIEAEHEKFEQRLQIEISPLAQLLYSEKSFAALNVNPLLLNGALSAAVRHPTKIQELLLSFKETSGKMLTACSCVGSGKTTGLLLAVLNFVDTSKRSPQVLVLCPTFELSYHSFTLAKQLSAYLPQLEIKLCRIMETEGEANSDTEVQSQVIIGTPSAVYRWASKIPCLGQVKLIALDDADFVCSDDLNLYGYIYIHSYLSEPYTLMVSSTDIPEELRKIADKETELIKCGTGLELLSAVQLINVTCLNWKEKWSYLRAMYDLMIRNQTVIFCNFQQTASWLFEQFKIGDLHSAMFSSSMTSLQKIALMQEFREGSQRILIATDLNSFSIEGKCITIIVNFDFPVASDGYADIRAFLYRIGRIRGLRQSGVVVNFVSGEVSLRHLMEIEENLQLYIEPLFEGETYDEYKDRSELLVDL